MSSCVVESPGSSSGSASSSSVATYQAGPGWRHINCALVFLLVLICYADRTNIGIVLAEQPFSGIPHEKKGYILSSFFCGYVCTQMLGGYLARRMGSKPTMLLAALVWTFADVLTPVAAGLGMESLVSDRFLMGLGEGMMFPAQHAFASLWVPTQERAFLITFMTSGGDLGSVAAMLVTPHLLRWSPWPALPSMAVFSFWGCLALAWCAVFSALGASAPEVHKPSLKSGEANWIQLHRGAPDFRQTRLQAVSMLPLGLLKEPSVWAIFAAHFGTNYLWYVILSWMPSFIHGKFQVRMADQPLLVALPFLASWLGGICGGCLGDVLVRRGFRTRRVRKFSQVLGAVSASVCLQFAAYASSMEGAATWIALGALSIKFQCSGYWVNMVDVCPQRAATIMGMSNTLATIPGIIGQPITQRILDSMGGEISSRAWSLTFGVGGIICLLGAAVFVTFGNDVSLDAEEGRVEEEGVKTSRVLYGRVETGADPHIE